MLERLPRGFTFSRWRQVVRETNHFGTCRCIRATMIISCKTNAGPNWSFLVIPTLCHLYRGGCCERLDVIGLWIGTRQGNQPFSWWLERGHSVRSICYLRLQRKSRYSILNKVTSCWQGRCSISSSRVIFDFGIGRRIVWRIVGMS